MRRPAAATRALAFAFVIAGCGGEARRDATAEGAAASASADDAGGPLTIFAAGSLARPMRAALDTFAAQTGSSYALESAGSLELARRLLDLGKDADVVALADEDVFPRLLMPARVTWYARFARNRLVLAHATDAPGVEQANDGAWRNVLLRRDVEVGRADPDLDPAGYRTLMLFQLAERYYGEPGLAERLEANSPQRLVRPKSAELVALLQARELDYAWMYESSARGARLPFIALPGEVDLGDERYAARYSEATVRVLGATMGDTSQLRGTPIRYAVSIPFGATRPALAAAFVRYLFSPAGQRVLRSEFLDAIAKPAVVGTAAPSFLDSLASDTGRTDEATVADTVPR